MAGGALFPGWLLWSLPAMFLLHDAEEVLFLPPWLRRNRELLVRRFPQLARRMLLHFDGISPPLAVCRHGCRRTGFAGGGNGLCGPCRLLLSVAGPVPCVRDAPADPSRAVGCRGTLCPRHCDVAAVPGLLWPGTVHHDNLPGLFAPGVRVMRDGGMCRRRGQSLAHASSGGAARRCMSPGDYFPCLGCCLSRIVCRSAMNLSGLAAPCMRPSSSPCVSKTR